MAIESSSSPSSSVSSNSSKAWIFGAVAAVAIGAQVYLRRSRRFRTRVVGIIPARFASSRFPGKPLVQILGKPMIQRTWERAKMASMLDNVVVATDDDKIAECCRGFGAEVVMTSESCRNGTERCNEALQKLQKKYDVVVNIQGDEPLIDPEIIDGIVKALQDSPDAVFSTAVTPLKPEDAFDPNRFFHKQSYDSSFLSVYADLPPTPLQLEEDLEQLKVLENGYKMKVILRTTAPSDAPLLAHLSCLSFDLSYASGD
ncbi:hypothetical protein V2J09_008821 [Rumex salicifolius]